jgi:two-component system KDP operon response regulator KdpE
MESKLLAASALWFRRPLSSFRFTPRNPTRSPHWTPGADDFLTKPCDLGELLGRIRTALRRVTFQSARVFTAGDLAVDLDSRTVQVANNPVQLTATEYDLLRVLVLIAGRLLTQRRLAEEVLGKSSGNALQLLRTTISMLRQKLDAISARPGHIESEPGVGYRLRVGPSA